MQFDDASDRLRNAVKLGTPEEIRLHVGNGGDVNALMFSPPMLAEAARAGKIANLKTLLELGADPNLSNGEALFAASESGQLQCVKALLRSGADISLTGRYSRYTPLLAACESCPRNQSEAKRYESIVTSLIAHGADFNTPIDTYGSPVESAIYSGNYGAFRALRDAGADDAFELEDRCFSILDQHGFRETLRKHDGAKFFDLHRQHYGDFRQVGEGMLLYSSVFTELRTKRLERGRVSLFLRMDDETVSPRVNDVVLMHVSDSVSIPVKVATIMQSHDTPPYNPRVLAYVDEPLLKGMLSADPDMADILQKALR